MYQDLFFWTACCMLGRTGGRARVVSGQLGLPASAAADAHKSKAVALERERAPILCSQ